MRAALPGLPGVQILAGHTPLPAFINAGLPGQYFQAIAGTSMSSPEVAGVLALLKQAHPDWSPAMAKSAIMTTAYQDVLKEDGVTPADPFDIGAGHVDPGSKAGKGSIFEPGLAYDAGFLDYLGFIVRFNIELNRLLERVVLFIGHVFRLQWSSIL